MKVGILGAGAIGLPLGYFLSAVGDNDVYYLVRPERVEDYENKTVTLFNYDNNSLIEYSNIKGLSTQPLLDDAREIKSNTYNFDLIVVTLPTDILESETGKQLIKALARRANLNTNYLVLSPGYTIYEKVFKVCGVVEERVVFGLPLFLSHEVKKSEEMLQMGANFDKLREADIAYHMLWNQKRIIILSKKPKTLKRVLKSCKKGSIGLGLKKLELGTAMFLILNLLLELQEYPTSLNRKDKSFKVAIDAWQDITRQYGWLGFSSRLFIGKGIYKLTNYFNTKYSKPLSYDFLKYHHGTKVKEQNIRVLSKYSRRNKRENNRIKIFIDLVNESNVQHFTQNEEHISNTT